MSSLNPLFNLLSLVLPDNGDRSHAACESSEELMKDSLSPSVADILDVKECLLAKLPIEVVDAIIDFAEYWPHTQIALKKNSAARPFKITGGGANENEFLLRSYPLAYIPKSHDLADLSFQGRSFPTCPPNPGFSDDRSQELTKMHVQRWTEDSQMRGAHPCRKIVFTLQSHDQGWGGMPNSRGTFENSFTWFDVGKEEACIYDVKKCLSDQSTSPRFPDVPDDISRGPYFLVPPLPASIPENKSLEPTATKTVFCTSRTISPSTISDGPDLTSNASRLSLQFNHPLLSDSKVLQKNLTAEKETKRHVITWSYNDNIDPESEAGKQLEKQGRGRDSANGEFVRSLKPGEIITVWGKARFPGWVNYVEEVMIDVYWAV